MKTKYLFPALLALASCSKKGETVSPPNPQGKDSTTVTKPDPDADSSLLGHLPQLGQGELNTKPNIIYIICDQMFVDKIHAMNATGPMGGATVNTPNLDYLLGQAHYFSHAYCAFPLSVPSRFSIFTGANSAEYGIVNNSNSSADQIAGIGRIPQNERLGYLFQNAGYNTVYGGKTHLPGGGNGAKALVAMYGFTDYYSSDVRSQLGISAASKIAEYAQKGKPFFLVASFINPHDIDFYDDAIGYAVTGEDAEGDAAGTVFGPIYDAAAAYATKDNYSTSTAWQGIYPDTLFNMPIPKPNPVGNLSYHGNNGKNMPGVHPGFLTLDGSNNPVHPPALPRDEVRFFFRQRAWIYDRLCEALDSDIGPIVNTIKTLGLLNNSIVIFTADHGELNGAHELERKQAPFEECQRVPFVWLGKGIKPGRDDISVLQTGVDLTPTLCDFAGITTPSRCTGLSIKGLLTGTSSSLGRDYIFTDGPKWNQVVYQGRYKYTVIKPFNNSWFEFLVDLQTDPGELKNLYNDPASQAIKTQLQSILFADLRRRGLEVPGESVSIYYKAP